MPSIGWRRRLADKVCGNCARYTNGRDFLLIANGLKLDTEPSIGCLGYADAPACNEYKPATQKNQASRAAQKGET